ncbi:MAG: glycosyltransferase family 1 protein [Desulfobacteraceae bacterium]|nr:MAG: glycosyltransferase family 1 protein [Desulfobacteraceae bacterium]
MKIAQIIGTFPPHHGGMGYICFHNTLQLAKKGHEITVFTLDYGINYHELPEQPFQIVRMKTRLMYGDAGMVPQLFNKLDDFQIIHLHYPFFGAAEYVYLAHLIKKKNYFLTYHMDVFGDTLPKRLVIAAYEPLLLKRIIKGAGGICSPGNDYLKSTKAGSFIPWEKITPVGYGGVDVERYRPREKNEQLIKKHGIEHKKVALFVGNLIPFKGLHILLDAIAEIDDKNLVLLVVGGGYSENEYKKQVRDLGIADRIIFAGPQFPDRMLPAYYNICDFLVLPSTHSESFGLVVIEAMASGKPVIVSALPGPSQLVNHGVDGLITKIGSRTDLKEKLLILAGDHSLCEKMGERARQKVVEKYTWETIGDQLEHAYEKVLNSSLVNS